MQKKIGIIQSRGLGDIIIALPIAKYHYDKGSVIYWPICEEFVSNFVDSVPWVNWISVPTDNRGQFFFETPMKALLEVGCRSTDILYLYQYLSDRPDLTLPELYNILKFDQYKYWVSGVPFSEKWKLSECIKRDYVREAELRKQLAITGEYAVTHLTGSNCKVEVNDSWAGGMRCIHIEDYETDSIFDWLGVLEDATKILAIDSVVANLVDSMQIGRDNYWIRRSSWDLTPVLGGSWKIVPTSLPIEEVVRIDPLKAALAMKRPEVKYPTSFMDTLKK